MAFDFERFCRDYSVHFITDGEKHCRDGWIQIPCPFCSGNPGWHMGFNIEEDYFHCWRCGAHRHIEVISFLAKVQDKEAGKIWNQYKGRPVRRKNHRGPKIREVKVKLPPGTDELKKIHRRYLKARKFDPDHLSEVWGIQGTGHSGSYKFRIIAPIYLDQELISYQGRDVTDKSPLKYKACSQDNERRDHKTSLYGIDQVPGNTIIIVEGITDVWRLGPGSVATFGIKYKSAQVNLMRKFKRRFILFDPEDPQAVIQSRKLANELSAYKGETEILEIEDPDPGSMSQKDADELMREILGEL